MSNRRIQTMAGILAALALALLLWQHWGMTLSNSDDPWIVRASMAQVLDTASVQGRFWLIPINLMAQIPYHLGSWEAANTVKIAVNGLVVLMFVLFCTRLTNVMTGLLIGLVWLAFIDVGRGYYSPFHGYLMMFNLQFAVLFLSFFLYLRRLDHGPDGGVIVVPFLLYGFAMLAYEPMFFYAAIFPALFLYRRLAQANHPVTLRQWVALALQFTKRNYPLALVMAAYVVAYFGYRQFQPTGGRGIDFNAPLASIAVTVYKFSIYGFHVQIKPLDSYFPGISTSGNVALAMLYAASIALAMLLIVPKLRDALYPDRLFSKSALAVILFFVFSPNILLGLVAGYRQWAAEDPHYVGNYFSSFALAIVVTLAVLHLVGGRRAAREKVLFAVVLWLFFSSACDNYLRWSNLAESNRIDSRLWWQAIVQLQQRSYSVDSPNVVCAQNAPEHVSGDDRYWSSYLTEVLATPITYTSKYGKATQCTQLIDFNTLRFPKPRG